MIDQLNAEHDRVRAAAARIEAFLDAPEAPRDPAFARLRWTLARELATHLATERHIYPKVRAKLRGDALYRGIDRELDDDLGRHMADWTVAAIEADWLRYRREARLLLRRLRRRMQYEETALFPLLAA